MIRDTLLVIDDSELDLAILNEIFKNLFRVECASDARQGLAFLRHSQNRVCAVLLDICLGRRSAGFTVLHQLQGDPDTASLPVILITTDANEKNVLTGVERGAVDFLVKPVNPHTVQERVCGVVRAAWPPQSTILDQPASQRPTRAEPEQSASFSQQNLLQNSQALFQIWLGKLTSFCRLRKGLDMASHRQLGELTALLAHSYARQFPQSGLTPEDADLIGMAAVFCDIGLLGIPDQAIETGEHGEGPDAQLYDQHVHLGYELLNQDGLDLPLLRCAADIALWHHKNADGSGYPQDLDGSAIPLSAQLTHAALRVQHYLHYYRGCSDAVERMLRMLKNEAGSVITADLYQTILLSRDAIEKNISSAKAQ